MSAIRRYASDTLNIAIKKTSLRLMPLLFILYFIAFFDRVNVGFAKEAMATDINLSDNAFAVGAGIFFVSYAIFGIPANMVMHKIGARIWLSTTVILWGILSACTGIVTNETQFIILRFFLGLGEAGFYPGILLLASIYFPDKVRASVISTFVLGVPFALTLGSPISGALLELQGFLGKPGWFWMFVLEGMPAVILGIITFFYIDDSPACARFLTEAEKTALCNQLFQEQKHTESHDVFAALTNRRVWHLAFIYGTMQIGVYGMIFFLPSQVAALMGEAIGFKSSLISAIPWAFSLIGVWFIPRYSDHYPNKRVRTSIICIIMAALGLLISSYSSPVIAIAALSVSAVGFLAVQPIFWTFPSQRLSGAALAVAIGFCTTMGAFCSFLAPILRVKAEQQFNSFHAGIIALTLVTFICGLLIFLLKNQYSTVTNSDGV